MFQQFIRNRFGSKPAEIGSNDSIQAEQGGSAGQCFNRGSARGGDARGGGNRPDSGPGGNCVCPQCGYKEPHVAGQRCKEKSCPKCGTLMIRE